MEIAWKLFTLALILKLMQAVIALLCTLRFFQSKSLENEVENDLCGRADNTQVILYILIPLLREQLLLPKLFSQFARQLQITTDTYLVFVTTEREVFELKKDYSTLTTMAVLQELIAAHPEVTGRIIHYHFPGNNRVVAEQLNYAIKKLTELPGLPATRRYVAVFNADSTLDSDGLMVLKKHARTLQPVMQQSSLFVANVPMLLKKGKYYLAMHGIYQSCWTVQHEIPRYLLSRHFCRWLPRWIERSALIHCVTHGLLIRLDVLTQVKGFPEMVTGGEDLALGYVLRAHGYNIVPICVFENSETPDRMVALWRQLAGWFLGTLGYFRFWRLVPFDIRRTNVGPLVIMSGLGICDSIKWLMKGILIILYLTLSCYVGRLISGAALYAAYAYISFGVVLFLWNRLPTRVFPRASWKSLVILSSFYWVILILRSGPALLGLWWCLKLALGFSFVKPKTERG